MPTTSPGSKKLATHPPARRARQLRHALAHHLADRLGLIRAGHDASGMFDANHPAREWTRHSGL